MKSYYSTLDIPDYSDTRTVTDAYRRLAMKWHPDRNNSADAGSIFVEIQTAYEILKNDEQRQYYDAWLREQQVAAGSTSSTTNFNETKIAQQARKYAYKYVDMSFEEFSSKIKVKAEKAAFTVLHWIGVGIMLLVIAVAGMVGKGVGKAVIGGNKNQEVREELNKMVMDMNRGLPRLLDSETRLDSISINNKILLSKHTFPNYKSSDIDPMLLETGVKKNLKGQLCKTAKQFLEHGYSYRYEYVGVQGLFVTGFSFSARDCGLTTR